MKKLWFNSLAVAALLLVFSACRRHTATETEQSADTSLLQVDTTVTQPDRTNVEPDSIPSSGSFEPGGGKNATPSSGTGDARQPGGKTKPGTTSEVDSIKKSYPPKK